MWNYDLQLEKNNLSATRRWFFEPLFCDGSRALKKKKRQKRHVTKEKHSWCVKNSAFLALEIRYFFFKW